MDYLKIKVSQNWQINIQPMKTNEIKIEANNFGKEIGNGIDYLYLFHHEESAGHGYNMVQDETCYGNVYAYDGYGNSIDNLNVLVREIASASIIHMKHVYKSNDTLNLNDLQILVEYNDGTLQTVYYDITNGTNIDDFDFIKIMDEN